MATTPVTLVPGGLLAASPGSTIFTATALTQIATASFTNNDTIPHVVTANIVRANGAAGPANTIVNNQTLASGQTFTAPQLSGRNFAAGDMLVASADVANEVNCIIDGFSVS